MEQKKMIRGKIYGINTNEEDASVILMPVPWEATVSPPSGTVSTPEHILKSSYNFNTFDKDYPKEYQDIKIAMSPIPKEWAMLSDQLQGIVTGYINSLESATNKRVYSANSKTIAQINQYCKDLKEYIKNGALSYLKKGKLVGIIGGDHSSCLGLIEALTSKYKEFGILQIDAQADLIDAHHGFEYSHRSVMNNVLKIPQINKIVQVGLRDYTAEEYDKIKNSKDRIVSFFDQDLKKQKLEGVIWKDICKKIVKKLPDTIYISFDIDGLDAKLCPGTAFPVPGGLEYDEVFYLFEEIVKAKKTIIGFDLCEVATGEHIEWDISVANKIIYQLIILILKSQNKFK
ncbi:MAG: agmatinase [Bacteroidetes bacterium]|nr:agmatinase [Bacteroidota bacterium]